MTLQTLFLSLWLSLSLLQATNAVPLRLVLRSADGAPLVGEPVTLERLPDAETVLPACLTDAAGACAWAVAPGLYQVRFARPLDPVSRLALAEGGLSGFGLTVGERPVTYHFTLAGDDHVYFDAAPEAARPDPVIPSLADLEPAPDVATATPGVVETPLAVTLVRLDEGTVPRLPGETADRPRWQLLLALGLGLLLGGGLHLWTRHWQDRKRPVARLSAAPGSHSPIPGSEDPDA